jgi:muramoyltetrapeptide carboxypeptidase
MESFVDLAYRGLSLGRRVKLTQVRPTTGYLETPAPMPVGTMIAIATDDGHDLEAIVTSIHEQVGGSDRHPGMTVKPKLEGAIATWWKERVVLPDEEPITARTKSVTVRPRSNTVVEDVPAGASAPPKPTTAPMPTMVAKTNTAPMPAASPPLDSAMAALAAASQTVAHASPPADNGRTIVMPAVDVEKLLGRTTSEEIPVARISDVMAAASVRNSSDEIPRVHDVMDDGKKTTMMDAVDLSALGLDLPGTTGQMAAVKDEENGDSNGDEDDPEPRKSSPNMPSSVKKRKKRDGARRVSAIIPPRIQRGQTLGVIAPAGPVRFIRLQRGIEQLGDAFRILLAPSLVSDTPGAAPTVAGPPREAGTPSYLSASDEVRAAELSAMIANPDVRAIILARGGYGIMRILARLDPELLRKDPKPIVGFSDATALLAWAWAAGVRAIHGPVVAQLADLGTGGVAQLVRLLTEPTAPGVRPWSLTSYGKGEHRGPLVPANLTLASMLVGTPWPLPLEGAIALFEEVGERPYEIDRYLTQLVLTGALGKTRAVLLGDLERCTDLNPPLGQPDPPDAALNTVLERVRAAGTPMAAGAPIGHGARNEAVPFGAQSILDLDHATLEITEAAVA